MLSRMALAATTATALILTGCSGEDESNGAAAENETRTVTHEVGEATVPVTPAKLVAFDENAGIAALAAGLEPAIVYTSSSDEGTAGILEAAGVELREAGAVELPPLEEVESLEPDMLLGTGPEGPTGMEFDKLSEIAPTVVLPITGTWRELTEKNGELLGADEGRIERQIAAIEKRLEAASGDAGDRTLSLLGNTFGSMNFTMPPSAPSSTLIADAGFDRPEFQKKDADTAWVDLSPELIPEQDADLIVLPEGTFYTPDSLLELPTAKELTGEQIRPLGELWFVSTPFSFFGTAVDLEAIAKGEETTTTETIGDLWETFLSEIEG
ncbi:ABC transporter substrate-binding protein [Corynebacterium sphenisci]|nr:ABC transporter substrate-binding protein [Corynebacterium sphenisci]